jgi:pilus assembly protein CpaD
MLMKEQKMSKAAQAPLHRLFWILALPLAACSGPDRIVTGSIVPDDYRQRHPIVIAEAPNTLDVFVAGSNGGGNVDSRTREQVRGFAERYRSQGRGQITLLFPRDTPNDAAIRAALPSIRRALVEGGARGSIAVASYRVIDNTLAAPVRLTYVGLKATVGSQCGQWPSDLASGSTMQGWENRQWWNFGCATQSTLAAQIDDPRDLVAARAESPSDVGLRTRAIGALRQGTDPSTSWAVKNTAIGNIGGGN